MRVPTLVLYRGPEESASTKVAARIPSSRAMRVPGDDYFGIFLSPDVVDEVERFVGGESGVEVPGSVLATLLFTDIVRSTERAAELGNRGWRDLLAQHNTLVRRELRRFRGEERDTAGDGFFATFDGPARAIRCAQAILASVGEIGLELRAGVHVGERELYEGKAGIVTSVAARVAALASPVRCSSPGPRGTRDGLGNRAREPRRAPPRGRARADATLRGRPRGSRLGLTGA